MFCSSNSFACLWKPVALLLRMAITPLGIVYTKFDDFSWTFLYVFMSVVKVCALRTMGNHTKGSPFFFWGLAWARDNPDWTNTALSEFSASVIGLTHIPSATSQTRKKSGWVSSCSSLWNLSYGQDKTLTVHKETVTWDLPQISSCF